MNTTAFPLVAMTAALLFAQDVVRAAEPAASWKPLFNGKDLSGWDVYLANSRGDNSPLVPNNDPRGVFTVTNIDGTPAIHVSGEIYGAVTTREQFTNFHFRVQCKWGEKRWPGRANVARDSGILYCSVGEPNPHTGWMTSVENNVMEKGIGQWWSVNGAVIDVEGEWITPEMELWVPYKKEGKGEKNVVYKKGAARITPAPANGITPPFDVEQVFGNWNTIEVIFWAGQCLHLLNGQVNLVANHPRYTDPKMHAVVPLLFGRIQLQSEAAECFYRQPEVRSLAEIPAEHLDLIPSWQDGEDGFKPLFGQSAGDGWAQCGPGSFTVDNGVATAHGGMGLWWHTNRAFTNFVLRGEFVQEQDIADSGVFVRFPHPGNDPWNAVKQGHEFEIGDPNPEKPTWRTGSIYPFKASTTANARPLGQWNQFEMVCINHDYSVRLNGKLVTTWSDPKQRSASGYLGLQNYNDGKTVRFRGLRVKELP
jgi:hypothetical protein